MSIKRITAIGFAAAMGLAGVLVAGPASAAPDDSCENVNISTAAGTFTGWHCKDASGSAVGGQLKDTNRADGKCVVLAVTFVNDGTLRSQRACYGGWPTWVGQASDYDVISIQVRTV